MAGINFHNFFAKDKTFRPKKKFEPGTLRYELHRHADETLSAGIDLSETVKLPRSEELNDWIAVHLVDFFNRINLLYGVVADDCSKITCPSMSGGPKYEYLWCDNENYKKPTALSAPQYISLLMEWIEKQINDESLFPCTTGTPFPKNFQSNCKKILSRLFRVFVHVYIHHFDRITQLGAEAHVNTCYKHFIYFVTEFNLLRREEIQPLIQMTYRMCPDLIEKLSKKQ